MIIFKNWQIKLIMINNNQNNYKNNLKYRLMENLKGWI